MYERISQLIKVMIVMTEITTIHLTKYCKKKVKKSIDRHKQYDDSKSYDSSFLLRIALAWSKKCNSCKNCHKYSFQELHEIMDINK